MFGNIYAGKKVLVTGHTGFKGAWLSHWLHLLGADVIGFSLAPNTDPSLFSVLNIPSTIHSVIGDIRDTNALAQIFKQYSPEFVFHLAAQPLVRLSYAEPLLTYQTNVLGTLHVLEEARHSSSVRVFINVTTDKCYENIESSHAYKETDPLGGYDMYSSSKACSEIVTASYRSSYCSTPTAMRIATARAGNVIGGGDWALDRLLPDCILALVQKKTIILRSPHAVRPWQHVLEPLAGYLLLASKLFSNPQFATRYNIGPENSSIISVEDIVKKVIALWGSGSLTVQEDTTLHEATLLSLDITKAKEELGFSPVLTIDEALSYTLEWYKAFYNNTKNMLDYTEEQIASFVAKAQEKTIPWSMPND